MPNRNTETQWETGSFQKTKSNIHIMRNEEVKSEFNWLSIIPVMVVLVACYPNVAPGIKLIGEQLCHTGILTISIFF